MSLAQDADAIIAEENLDNSQSATEDPPVQGDEQNTDDQQQDDTKGDDNTDNGDSDDKADDQKDDDKDAGDDKQDDADADAGEKKDDTPPVPTPPVEPPASQEVANQEAQTLLQTLQLTDDKVFDAEGKVKPFSEIINAGEFLSSRVEPVKVTAKDGTEHEFYTLDDVKEKFPDGFEAKNNIEQMQFQSRIMDNERKFTDAVNVYKNAAEQYQKETTALVEAKGENDRIGKEYRAMAEQGLVPKIEGDPNDPKFLESPAVKELNNILNWMDTKNKELREKGYGTINSVYVAKQMMSQEQAGEQKSNKGKEVIEQRKQVASLSSSDNNGSKDEPKVVSSNVPLSRLADEIIASEGLK